MVVQASSAIRNRNFPTNYSELCLKQGLVGLEFALRYFSMGLVVRRTMVFYEELPEYVD